MACPSLIEGRAAGSPGAVCFLLHGETFCVVNFRNWIPRLYGNEFDTIVVMEYWANDGGPLWEMPSSALIDLARQEIRRTGLVGDALIPEGLVERIKRSYPVYWPGHEKVVHVIQEYVDTMPNLHAIGRYGSSKHNN